MRRLYFRASVETRGKEWNDSGVRDVVEDTDARMTIDLELRIFRIEPRRGGKAFEGPLDMVRQWWKLNDDSPIV